MSRQSSVTAPVPWSRPWNIRSGAIIPVYIRNTAITDWRVIILGIAVSEYLPLGKVKIKRYGYIGIFAFSPQNTAACSAADIDAITAFHRIIIWRKATGIGISGTVYSPIPRSCRRFFFNAAEYAEIDNRAAEAAADGSGRKPLRSRCRRDTPEKTKQQRCKQETPAARCGIDKYIII